MRDLIEYCTSENLPLAIISLHQEKAFDRVNWNFLNFQIIAKTRILAWNLENGSDQFIRTYFLHVFFQDM